MSEKDKMKLMMLMAICNNASGIYIKDAIIKRHEKMQDEAFIRNVKFRLESLTEEDVENMATL